MLAERWRRNVVDDKRALVVGVTGISGNNPARQLLAEGWEVHGLSRGATR